jgi:hypothetical protein
LGSDDWTFGTWPHCGSKFHVGWDVQRKRIAFCLPPRELSVGIANLDKVAPAHACRAIRLRSPPPSF